MSQWARLHVETSDSEDVAALQAQDPNAALLFLMGMPHAMPWGVLPGSPALFRAKVCPLFDLSLSTVETCLRLLIDSGMMVGYLDSRGKPLVYYAAWNRYQGSQQWSRVGPPPHDLPPSWEPPLNIAQALKDAAREKRPLTAQAIEARLVSEESKTRLRLVLEESCLRSKKSESDNANDSLPEPAVQAPSETTEEKPEPHPKAKPRKALSAEQHGQLKADTLKRIPADCHPLCDAYLDAAAQANQRGQITAGREITLLSELADVAAEFTARPGAFRYGLQAAVTKGAVNRNYVRKAAAGYGQPQFGGNGATQKQLMPAQAKPLSDAERQILALRERQAREAAASGN